MTMKKNLIFILWRRIENCNTIELICDDVNVFKSQYAAHYHLTKEQKEFFWTRETLAL